MPSVTQATLLARLRVLMRDTADKTYTTAEKTEALAQAIGDDPYVYKVVRDEDTLTVSGQNNYDLPTNFQELMQVLIDISSDGFPTAISPSGYEVIDGTLWFRRNHNALPAGKKLVMIGKQKLLSTDSIPTYLAGYILHTAAAYLLELLMADKTGRFLKNDTSLAEIMDTINNHRSVAARYQRTLPNHNTVVF